MQILCYNKLCKTVTRITKDISMDETTVTNKISAIKKCKSEKENLARSIGFVDSIPIERKSKFDEMSKNEIKTLRLKDKGLL